MGQTYHRDGLVPSNSFIYVFGGNLAGKLVAPKAKIARNNFRVAYGTVEGLSEKGYAIPVRGKRFELLSQLEVAAAVLRFVTFASEHPKMSFFVTRVGCESGEFEDKDMALMFKDAPSNCSLPQEWQKPIEDARKADEAVAEGAVAPELATTAVTPKKRGRAKAAAREPAIAA